MGTMIRHLAVALLLLAAEGGDPFAGLVKEFVPGVSAHAEPTGRIALVTRLSGFDDPEGAKLLVAGLAALVDRLDRDLVAYASMRKRYDEVNFAPEDYLVFGRETAGLPKLLLEKHSEHWLRIPMINPDARSLNLSNCVALVLFEALRQQGFAGEVH